jgi:hypothetical protein
VFEKRVVRRIVGPKTDEVKSRRMRWAGRVARIGEERKVYRVLMGQPEGKRPLRRPRCRWDDGIRMYLREADWGSVE